MIKDIETLKKYVKVNTSLPFEVISPFINYTYSTILKEYLGSELLARLKDETNDTTEPLNELIDACVAPFSLMFGVSELSVRMSDSGFTVDSKPDNYVPASDKKIEVLRNDLRQRGYSLLAKVIEFLEKEIDTFSEWKTSYYYQRQNKNFIRSARQFQDIGSVNINYDIFVFDSLLPTMTLIEERFICERMGDELFERLREKADIVETLEEKLLVRYVCRFVALKTAEIYTSEDSKQNRQKPNPAEYSPIIRPLFLHSNDLNFYAEQAGFYWEKINDNLNKNADKYGIVSQSSALEWNSSEKKIFVDIG